jgi:hypothetical protein
MAYYLITSDEYVNHAEAIDQPVAWSLDNTKCIVEVSDDYTLSNYISLFNVGTDVNDWRFDPTTEEWRNWMTEEEYLGS